MNEMGGLAGKTPVLACFSWPLPSPPLVCRVSVIFGVSSGFSFPRTQPEHRFFLGLAALGIIISAIFGLRAVARIFFGSPSESLSERESKTPIRDLELGEILPAGLILAALLFIGLWPRGISDRINTEIGPRYERVDYLGLSQFTPACCLVEPGGEDSNRTSPDELGVPVVKPLSPPTDP